MLNVLLVEDDFDLAETVIDYLELEGIACDYASNGMAGLQLVEENSYDVVLLDLNLAAPGRPEPVRAGEGGGRRHSGFDAHRPG